MLVTGGELPTVGLNLRSAGRKCFEDSPANHLWCPEDDEVVVVQEADVLQVVDRASEPAIPAWLRRAALPWLPSHRSLRVGH
jgi:hypothetical protein